MMSHTLIAADARRLPLADQSVNAIVTSPPYWRMRDYQVEGQIGMEATPEEFVAAMVAVFREVHRVLRNDGSAWVVLGDSYANDTKWGGKSGGKNQASLDGGYAGQRANTKTGLKPKNLVGIPWRVALALQAEGWIIRSENIWDKPNGMCANVVDRPTRTHEQVFQFTKRGHYYYDIDAVREPVAAATLARDKYTRITKGKDGPYAIAHDHETPSHPGGRNMRSVWRIPTKSFPGAHFATYPPLLVERCIRSSVPVGGVVLDPFVGSGTTLLVAEELGRHGIGIDLKPEYLAMARQRLERPHSLLRKRAKRARPVPVGPEQLEFAWGDFDASPL
jgi:DNA modification methylase